MKKVIFFLSVLFAGHMAQAKVYDCFLFFNEFELLKIRLEEIYDLVDYFVIVEATTTFSGKKKELRFLERKEEFSGYMDKIIYVPVYEDIETNGNPWPRETFQRNAIMRGLGKANKNDIIIVSDVDEIPKREAIKEAVKKIKKSKKRLVSFSGNMYKFFLNRVASDPWNGPIAGRYSLLKQLKPEGFRSKRDSQKIARIKDAHWHLSNCLGFERLIEKITSFSHYRECNSDLDPKQLYLSIIKHYELKPIDHTFPKYIQEHEKELEEAHLIDTLEGYF